MPYGERQLQAPIRDSETGCPLAPKAWGVPRVASIHRDTQAQEVPSFTCSVPLKPHPHQLPGGSDGRGDPRPQRLHIPGSRPSSRVSSRTTCTSMARSRKRKAKVRQTERSPPSSALKYNRVTVRNILLGAGLRKP